MDVVTRPRPLERLTAQDLLMLWADELGSGPELVKDLRSLNLGVPYWVAIEAFNETGVSKLSRVVPVRRQANHR